MTTNFNIIKNVTDNFNLIIPDYVENITPVARIAINTIELSITPSLTAKPTIALALDSPELSITPTVTVGAPNTYTYYTTTGDSYLIAGLQYTFYDEQDKLIIGKVYSSGCKVWFPFVVTLNQGTTIVSAIINFVCSDGSPTGTPAKIKIGCEASGNPGIPTTYDELNMRVMTANFTIDTDVPVWNTGVTYSYDVTTAVQEILNRSDWVNGHILAVMCMDYGGGEDCRRYIASYENTTYTQASLVIKGP